MELPKASESNSGERNVTGIGCAGFFTVQMAGDVEYSMFYLPFDDLVQSARVEVKQASMRGGVLIGSYLPYELAGCFRVGMSVELQFYTWNDTEEDFEEYYSDPLLGASILDDFEINGEECDAPSGDPTFDPPEQWRIICSNVIELPGRQGGVGAHLNVPWGELILGFNGFDSGWKHRIP